jgi:hypothetical protein
MGFWDTLLGRRAPAPPRLDALFALPSAAITLQAALDILPTGRAAVAFRAPEGRAIADVQAEVAGLLAASGGPTFETQVDEFGFTWVVLDTDPPDVPATVTSVHAVNTALQDAGFGSTLLASHVGFRTADARSLLLVYLYKRGTFYPFAPMTVDDAVQRRDTTFELQVRDLLARELPIEEDTSRWFALWGAPGS